MDAAVDTTFSCESGFELDTTVTFVCATPNGACVALVLCHSFLHPQLTSVRGAGEASLSAEACVRTVVDSPPEEEAAEEEAGPRCPEDPACRADVSGQSPGQRQSGTERQAAPFTAARSALTVCLVWSRRAPLCGFTPCLAGW